MRVRKRDSHLILNVLLVLSGTGFGVTVPAHAQENPVDRIDDQGSSLKNWALLGPFPSTPLETVSEEDPVRKSYRHDYLESIGGESAAVFHPGDRLEIEGKEVDVFTVDTWDWGFNDIPTFSRAVGYASKVLTLEQDRDVYLYFMSHGSPQVWVNGTKVIEAFELRHHAKKMQYGLKLHLRKGENRFLVKLDNFRGWAGFQLELIPAETHESVVGKRLKALKLDSVTRDEQGNAELFIRHDPPAIDLHVPVRILLKDEAGNVLSTTHGMTYQPVVVPISRELKQLVTFEIRSAEDSPVKLKASEHPYYAGDMPVRCEELSAWFAEAKPGLLKQTPRMQPALDWIGRWLIDDSRHDPFDKTDVANLMYVEDLKSMYDQGRSLFIEEVGTGFPCVFKGRMKDGTEITGEYHITIPAAYVEAGAEARDELYLPLAYKLHGAGGTGRKLRPYRTARHTKHFDEVDHRTQVFLKVLPRATYTHRWDPEWLDVLHEHLNEHWRIDPEQVHLQGFSMGGWGTFVWGATHPERFATLTPMGMSGDRIFNTIGKENAFTALKGKKLWYIMGQQDKMFPDSITLFQELKEAGVDVRYSVYGSRAHGGLEGIAEKEGLSQWQLKNKLQKKP